jgi:chromosomal replication initiation ATPase DnaA
MFAMWPAVRPDVQQRAASAASARAYVAKRSRELGFAPADVYGPKRHRVYVDARARIAAELRAEPWRLSLPEIGNALGGRDHTTVMNLLGLIRRGPERVARRAYCPGGDHVCKDNAA